MKRRPNEKAVAKGERERLEAEAEAETEHDRLKAEEEATVEHEYLQAEALARKDLPPVNEGESFNNYLTLLFLNPVYRCVRYRPLESDQISIF